MFADLREAKEIKKKRKLEQTLNESMDKTMKKFKSEFSHVLNPKTPFDIISEIVESNSMLSNQEKLELKSKLLFYGGSFGMGRSCFWFHCI